MNWRHGASILVAVILYVSGGGHGPFALVFSKRPYALFDTPQACQIGLEAALSAYRTSFDASKSIRSGKRVWVGWVEGTPLHGTRDSIDGKQIYLLTCEEFPNPYPSGHG